MTEWDAEELLPLDVWDLVVNLLLRNGAVLRSKAFARSALSALDSLSKTCKSLREVARPAVVFLQEWICARRDGDKLFPPKTAPTRRALERGNAGEMRFAVGSVLLYARRFGLTTRRAIALDINRVALERNEVILEILREFGLIGDVSKLARIAAGKGWIAFLERLHRSESNRESLVRAANFSGNVETAQWFLGRGYARSWKSLTKFAESGDLTRLVRASELAFGDSDRPLDKSWLELMFKSLRRGHREMFWWLHDWSRREPIMWSIFLAFNPHSYKENLIRSALAGGCLPDLEISLNGIRRDSSVRNALLGEMLTGQSEFEWEARWIAQVRGPRTASDWRWFWTEKLNFGHYEWNRFFLVLRFFRESCRSGSIDAMEAVLRDFPLAMGQEDPIWDPCFDPRATNVVETLRFLAANFPLDKCRDACDRLWFLALQRAPKETLEEFYRLQRPLRRRSLGMKWTWLDMIARRSPRTRENCSRRSPPLVPILEWLSEVQGSKFFKDGSLAALHCAESDNWVVLGWLLDRGVQLSPLKAVDWFVPKRAAKCLSLVLSRSPSDADVARQFSAALLNWIPTPSSKIVCVWLEYLDRVGSLEVFQSARILLERMDPRYIGYHKTHARRIERLIAQRIRNEAHQKELASQSEKLPSTF